MSVATKGRIPKVKFREPELNLPGRKAGTITAETRFTIQFAKAYLRQGSVVHRGSDKLNMACARQVAVNGFGITDLLTVAWKEVREGKKTASSREFLTLMDPTIRAFEIKLENWRRGMSQAHRYRYFANAAILVLPADKVAHALPYLDTFRRIKVGLWSFDTVSGCIHCHFTPRPQIPIAPKYRMQAVQMVAEASKSLPILQTR